MGIYIIHNVKIKWCSHFKLCICNLCNTSFTRFTYLVFLLNSEILRHGNIFNGSLSIYCYGFTLSNSCKNFWFHKRVQYSFPLHDLSWSSFSMYFITSINDFYEVLLSCFLILFSPAGPLANYLTITI